MSRILGRKDPEFDSNVKKILETHGRPTTEADIEYVAKGLGSRTDHDAMKTLLKVVEKANTDDAKALKPRTDGQGRTRGG